MYLAELINGPEVFSRLADVWDKLASLGMTDTPFQTLAYQRGWWRHLRPDGATLHTIVARNDDGEPQAIACFFLHDGVLYFNGCVEETDYLDLVGPAAIAESAWRTVFGCLMDSGFPDWHSMDLCNVPEASLTRRIVPLLAANNGLTFVETVHEVCPVIPLPGSFEAYLTMLDRKQRHELRRKLRRADGADLGVWQANGNAELASAVDEFLALLQKSSLEKQDWLNERRRALFHETAKAAAEADMLQLLFIEKDGRPAAALFNFDYKGRIWVYNSGLDPAAFGHLSPGVVITARAIEMAIANGRTEFDFLRGAEIYKYRFGAQDTRIFRLTVMRDA